MRKLIGIFIAVLLAGLLPSPLLADGIIIIDPPLPPQPEPLPWLTIRYHHVQVTLEDQVAVTRVD